MAAVFAGMTILELAELAEALNDGALSLFKIHDELHAKGGKDTDPVPLEHHAAIDSVMNAVTIASTPSVWDADHAGEGG
jgi:hypothetical protein